MALSLGAEMLYRPSPRLLGGASAHPASPKTQIRIGAAPLVRIRSILDPYHLSPVQQDNLRAGRSDGLDLPGERRGNQWISLADHSAESPGRCVMRYRSLSAW